MNENEEENTIICLNYCVFDEETGYCLTCGRPPVPVETRWMPTPENQVSWPPPGQQQDGTAPATSSGEASEKKD